MSEFLDRGRSGSNASTFLTRLQTGGKVVDGQVVAALHRNRISGWLVAAPARRGRRGGGRRAARVAGRRRRAGVGPAVHDGGGRTGPGRCAVISLRYHAVSIAAVFLALAVGVVLGSSGVSDRVLAAVSTQRDDLGAQVDPADRRARRAGRTGAGSRRVRVPGRARPRCAACWPDRPSRSSWPAPTCRTATPSPAWSTRPAGPSPVRSSSPMRSATPRARTSCASSPPSCCPRARSCRRRRTRAASSGDCSAGCCWPATGRPPSGRDDADSVLTGLTSAGFVHPGQVPGAANLVLVLTGGAQDGIDAADTAAVYARLAAQLDLAGRGAVLAGRSGSADATGAVGVARADPQVVARLSTVDDVQSGTGRIAAVLALHEQLDEPCGQLRHGNGRDGRCGPRGPGRSGSLRVGCGGGTGARGCTLKTRAATRHASSVRHRRRRVLPR